MNIQTIKTEAKLYFDPTQPITQVDVILFAQHCTELALKQEHLKSQELINALKQLINIAEQCDGWESFPSNELDNAYNIINQYEQ